MENKEYIVPGFSASAVPAGIKKNAFLDLALIFSEKEAIAAGGLHTSNQSYLSNYQGSDSEMAEQILNKFLNRTEDEIMRRS